MDRLDRRDLGAWVVTCNPSKWKLTDYLDAGHRYVRNWRVRQTYRLGLMQVNDPVLFWVAADKTMGPAGFRGSGTVSAEGVWFGRGDSYWTDPEVGGEEALFAGFDITLWDDTITAEELRAAGLDDLEVLGRPYAANPLWVSAAQMDLLNPLLPPAADVPITITPGVGAGYGTAEHNRLVEKAAIAAAKQFYRAWPTWRSVERDNCGWDITFRRSSQQLCVEVKGTSGPSPTVLLTPNEYREATVNQDWRLLVVTSALTNPQAVEYTAAQAIAAAQPRLWELRL